MEKTDKQVISGDIVYIYENTPNARLGYDHCMSCHNKPGPLLWLAELKNGVYIWICEKCKNKAIKNGAKNKG